MQTIYGFLENLSMFQANVSSKKVRNYDCFMLPFKILLVFLKKKTNDQNPIVALYESSSVSFKTYTWKKNFLQNFTPITLKMESMLRAYAIVKTAHRLHVRMHWISLAIHNQWAFLRADFVRACEVLHPVQPNGLIFIYSQRNTEIKNNNHHSPQSL